MTENTEAAVPGGQVLAISTSASGVVGQGTGPPVPGDDEQDEEQP